MNTRVRVAGAVSILLAVAAAFVIGRWSSNSHVEPAHPEKPFGQLESRSEKNSAPRETVFASCNALVDPGVLRDAIRSALAEAPVTPAAKYGADAAPAKAPVVSVESRVAQQTADAVVTRALSAHVWGKEDVAEMRGVLPQLDPQQTQAMMSRLLPAINRGEVKLQTDGPLF